MYCKPEHFKGTKAWRVKLKTDPNFFKHILSLKKNANFKLNILKYYCRFEVFI